MQYRPGCDYSCITVIIYLLFLRSFHHFVFSIKVFLSDIIRVFFEGNFRLRLVRIRLASSILESFEDGKIFLPLTYLLFLFNFRFQAAHDVPRDQRMSNII